MVRIELLENFICKCTQKLDCSTYFRESKKICISRGYIFANKGSKNFPGIYIYFHEFKNFLGDFFFKTDYKYNV